jgi:hypothetical protein
MIDMRVVMDAKELERADAPAEVNRWFGKACPATDAIWLDEAERRLVAYH